MSNISFWIFYGQESFLPFPLAAGLILAFIQKGERSYQYFSRLAVGSLVFGFLTALLSHAEVYLISNLFYKTGIPFWVFYKPKEYLAFSLVFSFICLVGGLAGIVIKGLYIISKHKLKHQGMKRA